VRKPSPETLRLLKRVAIGGAVGVVVFVVALYVWFPYDRAKEVVINLASAQNLDVEIESVGPAWGLGLAFSNIHVKTRPTSPTAKPTRIVIERATVSMSPLSLLFFWTQPELSVSIDGFGGHVEVTQSGSAAPPNTPPKAAHPFSLEVSARDVDMSQLPGIRETLNLPVTGTLKLDLDLASATGHYANAKGELSFTCTACVLGDGKTPLRIEGNPFLGGGLTLPKVRVGDLRGEVGIDGGTAKLKDVGAKSPDLELTIEGDVSLRDPLPGSLLNVYLRFKLSDAFLKSAGTLSTLLQMAGASGKRPDGFYGVRILGRAAAPSTMLSATSPTGGGPPLGAVRGRPGIAPSTYTPPPPPPQPAIMPMAPPPAAPPVVVDNPPPPPPPPPSPPPDNQVVTSGPPPSPPAPPAPDPAGTTPPDPGATRGAPPPGPEGNPPPPAPEGPPPPAPVPAPDESQ
jgi:type II secretion system protein N